MGVELWRRCGAEAVGTFVLVGMGCGAIVVDAQTGALGHAGICAAFGIAVAIMVHATGHLSGAHFNPAVTLAFATTGELGWRDVGPYVAAQVVGATGASLCIAGLLGTEASLGATAFSGPTLTALGIEGLLTALLMFVIHAVATDVRAAQGWAAWAIGATVALAALVGGPLTGASMNPARSIGPELVAHGGLTHWVYLVGPVFGAVIGAWLYQVLRGSEEG